MVNLSFWIVWLIRIAYITIFLLIVILFTRRDMKHQYSNKDDYYVWHDENGEMHIVWAKDKTNE